MKNQSCSFSLSNQHRHKLFLVWIETLLIKLNSPFIQETDNHQDACYSEDRVFHFVPCNYEKKRKKKKVLKIKRQEFKVPYSALKFREGKAGEGGQVRSG